MSVAQKLRWKKLVNQLRYMYEELDIVTEMSSEAAKEFQEYYEAFCHERDVDIAELNRQNAERIQEIYGVKKEQKAPGNVPYSGSTDLVPFEGEPEAEPTEQFYDAETGGMLQGDSTGDDRDMYDIFSKLFKKLALHLHPDKLANMDLTEEEKNDMLNMFTKAKAALEERRYFILIDYAERLKVPLPKNYKQQTRWMKRELEVVRGKIGGEMRSYNYLFAEADSDEAKDNLIRQFIQQLFQVTIP